MKILTSFLAAFLKSSIWFMDSLLDMKKDQFRLNFIFTFLLLCSSSDDPFFWQIISTNYWVTSWVKLPWACEFRWIGWKQRETIEIEITLKREEQIDLSCQISVYNLIQFHSIWKVDLIVLIEFTHFCSDESYHDDGHYHYYDNIDE